MLRLNQDFAVCPTAPECNHVLWEEKYFIPFQFLLQRIFWLLSIGFSPLSVLSSNIHRLYAENKSYIGHGGEETDEIYICIYIKKKKKKKKKKMGNPAKLEGNLAHLAGNQPFFRSEKVKKDRKEEEEEMQWKERRRISGENGLTTIAGYKTVTQCNTCCNPKPEEKQEFLAKLSQRNCTILL